MVKHFSPVNQLATSRWIFAGRVSECEKKVLTFYVFISPWARVRLPFAHVFALAFTFMYAFAFAFAISVNANVCVVLTIALVFAANLCVSVNVTVNSNVCICLCVSASVCVSICVYVCFNFMLVYTPLLINRSSLFSVPFHDSLLRWISKFLPIFDDQLTICTYLSRLHCC